LNVVDVLPVWESDQEVTRGLVEMNLVHGSSARNPLYSCLYLKLAKMICLSYYLLCFLFNKIGEQEGGTGSAQKQGERWHKQCIYM
jgi:hypothetical protein